MRPGEFDFFRPSHGYGYSARMRPGLQYSSSYSHGPEFMVSNHYAVNFNAGEWTDGNVNRNVQTGGVGAILDPQGENFGEFYGEDQEQGGGFGATEVDKYDGKDQVEGEGLGENEEDKYYGKGQVEGEGLGENEEDQYYGKDLG